MFLFISAAVLFTIWLGFFCYRKTRNNEVHQVVAFLSIFIFAMTNFAAIPFSVYSETVNTYEMDNSTIYSVDDLEGGADLYVSVDGKRMWIGQYGDYENLHRVASSANTVTKVCPENIPFWSFWLWENECDYTVRTLGEIK